MTKCYLVKLRNIGYVLFISPSDSVRFKKLNILMARAQQMIFVDFMTTPNSSGLLIVGLLPFSKLKNKNEIKLKANFQI